MSEKRRYVLFHCRTGSTEEYLALPKSTDDKDFDESVLKSCQGRVKIPSTKTRDDANRYLLFFIHNVALTFRYRRKNGITNPYLSAY